MSGAQRLPGRGLVDRARTVAFRFDGRDYAGFAGDTLASALLAHGVRLVGRSLKYHRPRGIVGLGIEEPAALVAQRHPDGVEPNLRATMLPVADGLIAEAQNCWPGLRADFGAAAGLLAPFLPAGFYYKTFMAPRGRWLFYERFIRRAAGLGPAPEGAGTERYARRFAHADVLVAGAGPAGLAAALAAAAAGARVVLALAGARPARRLLGLDRRIEGRAAAEWARDALAALAANPRVTVLPEALVAGAYDHGLYTIAVRGAAGDPAGRARGTLWKLRARTAVLATGATERLLLFPDNDRPGVMLASAIAGYLHRFGVLAGRAPVLVGNNDTIYAVALALADAGAPPRAIADLRPAPGEAAQAAASAGLTVLAGHGVVAVEGARGVRAVRLAPIDPDTGGARGAAHRFACDVLGMSGGFTPQVQLCAQAREPTAFDAAIGAFLARPRSDAVHAAGAVAGTFALDAALAEGHRAGLAAVAAAGLAAPAGATAPRADAGPDPSPAIGGPLLVRAGRGKRFVDLQNDVTADDLALALREGYRSIEHVKRYTTLGMGTDQGRIGTMAGIALVAAARGEEIGAVGTPTFRPPASPVSIGAIIGAEPFAAAQPLRRTPADAWHAANGAVFTNAGLWRRPQFYRRPGESDLDAVNREVRTVRSACGVIDVSTLGKIEVQGPDAAALLDHLYMNSIGTLPVGRARYGIMLRPDGMPLDDGVAARLSERHFVLTASTGHVDTVFEHVMRAIQTGAAGGRAFATLVTEQWFTAALAGPRARAVLAALAGDGLDVGAEALPPLGLREGQVAGIPARIVRVSFSGELAYEISVPAGRGLRLWQAILAAGAAHGIAPYGTESMGVMRIEKGFLIVGREADGRSTPHDLGLERMVARRKSFIGSRSLRLPAFAEPGRRQLVGVTPVAAGARLPVGGHLVADPDPAAAQPSLGFLTSHCWSPTLDRSIGLALLADGRARIGSELHAVSPTAGQSVRVRIVAPCFVDPEGARANG